MVFADFLFVIAIAVLLTTIFGGGFRRTGPWEGWWRFFIIMLLVGWVAALWAQPLGPQLWGVYWLPMFWLALLFALLLAAVTPPPRRPRESTAREAEPAVETAAAAATVMGGLLWILLIALLIAVAFGYVFQPPVT